VALGYIVATASRRAGILAFAVTLGALPGYALLRTQLGVPIPTGPHGAWDAWEFFALTAVIAALTGHSIRQVRQYTERLRTQAAAQAVTAERLRIARELHDMVAHSIGIIALQAGAAARVVDTQPARAREAMIAVETTGRETLTGLRRMLGALREADGRTAPTLADLGRLTEATAAAGVHVDVRWRGERRPLPPEVDLSAYRIIQESLTNVVRHAGTDSCRVTVDHRGEDLGIEIADDGRGGTTGGTGYGLIGMRERVTLLRGDFTAEPAADGGFRVTARIPLPAPIAAR
jgi:signal transduction histidine kinase